MRKELEQRLQMEFSFMINKNENARKYNFDKSSEFFQALNNENKKCSIYEIYGCQCGDGWYDLIRSLCLDIASMYKAKGIEIDLVPMQIKQKFGALIFYFETVGQSDVKREIRELTEKWKELSIHICEFCGSEGYLRKDLNGVKTLCDSCYQKHTG